jgi:hypothetical protein
MKTKSADDFSSRKFLITISILIVGSIALLIGKLGGGEYVALATLILGVYASANVVEKRQKQEPKE